MIEDMNSGEVDQDELNQWDDQYGLSMPTLTDPGSATMWSYANGGSVGLPYTMVIDRGGVIVKTATAEDGDIDQLLGQ
jgi:hypothetical protein